MATLTQCLSTAMLRAHPAPAGAPSGREAGGRGRGAAQVARAVLSVLVAAGRGHVQGHGAGQGRRSARAALVPVVLGGAFSAARPMVLWHGRQRKGQAHGRVVGRMGRQMGGAARAGEQGMPAAPAPALAPAYAPIIGRGGVQAASTPVASVPAAQGGRVKKTFEHTERFTPKVLPQRGRAGAMAGWGRPGAAGPGQAAAPALANTPLALAEGAARPADVPVRGAGVPRPTLVERGGGLGGHAGQRALVVLAGGLGHAGHTGGGVHGLQRLARVLAQARGGPLHAGFMADVLGGAAVKGATPGVPAQHLQASRRAVGVASALPLQQAAPAPTVQAQITINATGSSPRAIGDELEHRMDTLRMQARQANMGQF